MRGGLDDESIPQWMMLAHPLLVAFTKIERGQGICHKDDLATGSAWIRVGGIQMEVYSNATCTEIEIDTTIPETVLDALPGRALRQLVEIPRSGRDDVDAAVQNLVVGMRIERDGPPTLRIATATWLPLMAPPDSEVAAAWLRHAFRA